MLQCNCIPPTTSRDFSITFMNPSPPGRRAKMDSTSILTKIFPPRNGRAVAKKSQSGVRSPYIKRRVGKSMLARESRIYSGVLDGLIGQGDGAKWTLRNDHSTSLTGAGKILKRREIIIVVNHLGRAVYREIVRVRADVVRRTRGRRSRRWHGTHVSILVR